VYINLLYSNSINCFIWLVKLYILIARKALLYASTSLRVEMLSKILFLLMAKCRGNGREPSQRVQRYRSTLWR
jgi:hypothetical protein